MKITINGKEKNLEKEMNLASLSEMQGIPLKGIVVELNMEIIHSSMFEQTIIKDGDIIELIRIVGGG